MSRWVDRFLLSSLGRKYVMAATGFLLVGFLIAHLAGNLTLYGAADGASFVRYAQGMHDFGVLMYAGEIGLVLLFFVHVYTAVRLTMINRAARPIGYAVKRTFGESTIASRSMFVTGSIILGFLVVHLLDFRLAVGVAPPHAPELLGLVRDTLTQPLYAAIYLVGSLAVGVHLAHGFRSAFQSLGANHPQLNRLVSRLGLVLAILLAVGFASFPLIAIMQWKGGAQ
jgi:succinate dehydrogenase / fumarate reductase, cytochrome b subunit